MESKIIDRIFQEEVLKNEPPVLIDLGGSGGIHQAFNKIEPYSIIICVDADKRDFEIARKKNVIPISTIVSELENKQNDFYLTSSPYCSSILKPLPEKLSEYSFAELFKVVSQVQLESVTLKKILEDNNIKTVDWFKADTQGTDLRLFKNLPDVLREKVIVAEFEPGIIDAYAGEDKFFDVLAYMNDKPYWVDDAVIKGSKRFDIAYLSDYLSSEKLNVYENLTKVSPGWCEVSFINTFESKDMQDKRYLLLGIVFSVLKNQLGFALKLICMGKSITKDPVFDELIPHMAALYSSKVVKPDPPSTLSARINRKIKRLL